MHIEDFWFEITFTASRAGRIKHIVKQPCEKTAVDRIRAAYPDQTLMIHTIRKNSWMHLKNSPPTKQLKVSA